MQDLRYALRTLRQNPGFTVTAVIALALGIGANTAMFSVVDGVLLKPLPFEDPSKLVIVRELFPKRAAQAFSDAIAVPPGDYLDYYSEQKFFEKFAAYRNNPASLLMPGADPERHFGAAVTQEYFDVFRVKPILGRLFDAEEMLRGADAVVILSHGLWAERFGGDPNILNRKLNLNGRDRQVIGIMPPDFDQPAKTRLWVPVPITPEDRSNRQTHNLMPLARLKPDATIEQARAQLQSVLNRIGAEYPDFAKDKQVLVIPMAEDATGKIRPALLALLGAVGFVLAISCANVANLLLARGAARQQELAVRAAMGAERGRLVRQLLTESLALSFMGGLLGLILALGAFFSLKALAPSNLPRLDQVAIDGRALLFTMGAAILTGLLFGLLPALKLSRVDLHGTLKERARGSTVRNRLRSALVVGQVAAALILLTGAGLLMRSFYHLLQTDMGFDPAHLMTMRITPLPTKFGNSVPLQIQLGRDILAKVREVPGIRSAGFSTDLPLLGNPRFIMRFEGFPPVTVANSPVADVFSVSPEYFSTMGMRLKKGRFFTDSDDNRAPMACIVNEQLARTYFPNQDPIGRRLEIGFDEPPRWRTIVGIVSDVKNIDLEKPSPVQVYSAYYQQPGLFPGAAPSLSIVVRAAGDPAIAAEPVRRAILAADNSQPVFSVQTMDKVVAANVAQRKFSLLLMAVFAAVALVLAIIGLSGVISYMVTQRTQEIGIRMALGAQVKDVIWLVQRHALKLVIAGVIVGTIGAIFVTRTLASILFGVNPYDPVTFIAVVVLLVAVAAAAVYFPARRATRIDPVIALRQE